MKGFHSNIVMTTIENENFRQVLYTGKYSQLVIMFLQPGQEIGAEVHSDRDQYFRFEAGQGTCIVDDNEYQVAAGHGLLVPAGARHNIINTSSVEPLQMLTIYSPPEHADGTVHSTKEKAESAPRHFDGKTTE